MASTSPSSSSWKPSARRAVAEAPAACGVFDLLADAGLEHRVDAGVDALGERARGPSSSAASSVGWRVCVVHSCEGACAGGGGCVAGLEQLVGAQDALAVGGLDPGCDGGGSSAWSACERPRVARPASADRGVDGRPQVELGQRRPQVQAGAADDDRPPALAEQRVDRRVGVRGVGAGGEGLGDRHEAEQAVLEPCLLGRGRRAGEDRQALVDLQRVRGHGDRVLPALAQPLGERDRDGGLPHARRARRRR